MFRHLIASIGARRRAAAHYSLPPETRVYAIGDVHGRLDCLLAVEAAIRAHLDTAPPVANALVVLVGDYIDRGADSAAVIQHLVDRRFAGLPAHCLFGNHEEAMLAFLADPIGGARWLDYGGMETLASYGVVRRGPSVDAPGMDTGEAGSTMSKSALVCLRDDLQRALPLAHRDFLEALELWIRIGDCLFVHAGIRPGLGIDEQDPRDLTMIRQPFLESTARHPWRVVHGHTIVPEPVITFNRVSLDTGAYQSGILSCVVLEGCDATVLGGEGRGEAVID